MVAVGCRPCPHCCIVAHGNHISRVCRIRVVQAVNKPVADTCGHICAPAVIQAELLGYPCLHIKRAPVFQGAPLVTNRYTLSVIRPESLLADSGVPVDELVTYR